MLRYSRYFLILVCLLLLNIHLNSPVKAAATFVDPNFHVETLAEYLDGPTAMAFAPDGRLFILRQSGTILIYKDGALLPNLFMTLAVETTSERGLLGIAFHPHFANNHYFYLYYTTPDSPIHNRISRFTANGDVVEPGSETVIFDLDNLSSVPHHNGGTLAFGPDGKLYAAAGDNGNSANAQSLTTVLGSILRLKAGGGIPTDNPFYTTASGKNRAIWAYGLRNPFFFTFQPGTGRMHINDVGESQYEEIDLGQAGANYGWPIAEGDNVTGTLPSDYVGPLYTYDHSNSACAITGGAFYNPASAQFPASYDGDYFFTDYCAGWIRVYDVATAAVSDFSSAIGTFPVALAVAPDGSLYYLSRGGDGGGMLQRIYYDNSALPENVNAVSNGDFSAGVNDWSVYGPLDAWAPDGVMMFKRRDNSAPGGFLQATGYRVSSATPFEVNLDLGNSGGFDKQVLVRLSDSSRASALDCVFTVNRATPLQSYSMRGLSPFEFDDLSVTIEELTYDGYPDVLLDNLDVRYQPNAGINSTTCTSPTMQAAPGDQNMVRNGDFSMGNQQWIIWGNVDGWSPDPVLYFKRRFEAGSGGVYQNLLHTVPAGAPLEATLQLGNTSDVVKTVQVVLSDGTSWDDARICNFAVFPNTPLQTFTLQAQTTTAWSDIRLETNPGPPDSIPDIVMDNVAVYYHPSASYPVTVCSAPPLANAPGMQNLVRNGDFSGGEGDWTRWGDVDTWAPDSTMYTKRWNGGGDGGLFQDLFYGVGPNLRVNVTIDFANTSAADKVAQIFLHDDDWSHVLTCDFNLPGGQSEFNTFYMYATTTGQWNNMRLEIKPQPADGIPDIHIDNVYVEVESSLSVTGTVCENVTAESCGYSDRCRWGRADAGRASGCHAGGHPGDDCPACSGHDGQRRSQLAGDRCMDAERGRCDGGHGPGLERGRCCRRHQYVDLEAAH